MELNLIGQPVKDTINWQRIGHFRFYKHKKTTRFSHAQLDSLQHYSTKDLSDHNTIDYYIIKISYKAPFLK
jgi:hypothetical protein